MSIIIEKAGMLDTLQDAGRTGYGHLGVNPNGPMDWFAFELANALVGNSSTACVIESHFPAPVIHIDKAIIIAFTGADFQATFNGQMLPINRTIFMPAGSTIRFNKKLAGERLYIAVQGGFEVAPVLGSNATNLKAGFGGIKGTSLKTGDILSTRSEVNSQKTALNIFPWYAYPQSNNRNIIRCWKGPEFEQLAVGDKVLLLTSKFSMQSKSDRMAIRWQGPGIALSHYKEMISSPVVMGTTQLLPNGAILTLMADHQTVGGYPRILQVIKADLPKLAQLGSGASIQFELVDTQLAIAELKRMKQEMQSINAQVKMRMPEILQ